jgi:hypothetical protein
VKQQRLFAEADAGKAEVPVPVGQAFQLAPEIYDPETMMELIQENYVTEGEVPFLFDRVRLLAGGATNFQMRGEEPGQVVEIPEIVGVIVDQHKINAYWPGDFSGEGTPPQCYSHDGKTGTGDPGGDCESCPQAKWGTGKKERGRACKNMRRLYVLRSGETLPVVLTLPPTSLKAYKDFVKKLTFKHRMTLHEAVVRITLRREKNADGIPYSEVAIVPIERLPKEAAEAVKRWAEQLKIFTRRPPRTAAEIVQDYAPAVDEAAAAFGEEPDF